MKTRADGEIVLSGPPGKMAGAYPYEVARTAVVPLSISVRGQATIYRAIVRPSGTQGAELRLRLPTDTPPGAYAAEATIDGKAMHIRLDVEPVMRIRVEPRQTHVNATATSSVEFELTVMNSGNVPFDVPKADTVDLDDATQQDRALGRTLRAALSQGERRIDRYFEELREGHGGEARLAIRSGAGRLEPGESRELTCMLDVPVTAKEGRSYLGPWQLGNTAHVIVADITSSARPDNGRTKG